MFRGGEHHVLEFAEDVRPNYIPFVASGQRRDEHFGGGRNAQVIRPERDETRDKRTRRGDAIFQSSSRFAESDFKQYRALEPNPDPNFDQRINEAKRIRAEADPRVKKI